MCLSVCLFSVFVFHHTCIAAVHTEKEVEREGGREAGKEGGMEEGKNQRKRLSRY